MKLLVIQVFQSFILHHMLMDMSFMERNNMNDLHNIHFSYNEDVLEVILNLLR